MNPHLCRVALRPRDPFEVFDLSLGLLRACAGPYARLFALVVVPPWLITAVVAAFFEWHPAAAAVPFVLSGALKAPFTVLTGRLLFAPHMRARDALRETLTRLGALVQVWGVGAAGVLAALLTCGIVAPFVHAAVLYLPETALLERVGIQRGVQRSSRLAYGHLGITAVGALAWFVLAGWLAIVAELGGQAITEYVLQLGPVFGSILDGKASPFLLLGLFAAQPLHAVYRLLLYVDVRTRVEGWDLQVALRAAGLAT